MSTFAVTSPTCVGGGQPASELSCATAHSGVAVGLPIRPGGRWMVRSRTLSSGPDPVNGMLIVKSVLAPPWVSAGWADSPSPNPIAAFAPGAPTRHASAAAAEAIHALRTEPDLICLAPELELPP